MATLPQSQSSLEVEKLLLRILHMKNSFRRVLLENSTPLNRLIHDSNQSGKSAGITDPGLLYSVGFVFSCQPEPITMGELSRELDIPLSTATRIMDWLVSNGYVERLSDLKDRRIVRVSLTQEGKESYQAIRTSMLERVEQAMNQLTASDQEIFISLLTKVLNAFEEAV
jgi:DNA-binding MarR family transcriptional regulator